MHDASLFVVGTDTPFRRRLLSLSGCPVSTLDKEAVRVSAL